MNRSFFRRAVAALTAAAVAFTSAVPAGAADLWSDRGARRAAAPTLASAAMPPAFSLPPVGRLGVGETAPLRGADRLASVLAAIPASAGRVRRVSLPDGAPRAIVIHIQDVHRNPEAQANIASAVSALAAANKAGFIALEGAWAPVDLDAFRSFPDRAALIDAARALLQQNIVTGPVLAALSADAATPVVGVDDRALHGANADAVRAALARQPAARAALARDRADLDRALSSVNPSLRAVIAAADGRDGGTVSLSDYLAALARTGVAPPSGVARFLKAGALERSLDFARVERERGILLEKLVARLNAGAIRGLLADTAAFRAGVLSNADFYGRLARLCAAHGVPLSATPAMDAYLRYVVLADGIDADRLFDEARDFERAAFDAAAATPRERDLAARDAALRRQARLVDLALSPSEWDASRETKAGDPFEAFYARAADRDDAMARNMLREIETRRAATAILVTGGFHGPGIARRLRARGVAVVTFVPALSKIDVANATAYLSVFAQEKTPLDRLFEGQKLFLAEEVMTAPARARLGLAAAALAALRGATSREALAAFLARGLRMANVTVAVVQRNLVRVSGLWRVGQDARMVEFDISDTGLIVLRQGKAGLFDVFQPAVAALTRAARSATPAWRLVAAAAGLGAAQEAAARLALVALVVAVGAQAMPFALVLAAASLVYAVLYASALNRRGAFAAPDGENALTTGDRRQLFLFSLGMTAIQVALAGVPVAGILVPAALSAAWAGARVAAIVREARRLRPVAGDAEMRAVLEMPNDAVAAQLPRVKSALRWLHDHPSVESQDFLFRIMHRAWVERDPEIGAAFRRELRYQRQVLRRETGPSERARSIVDMEQIIASDDRTLAEKFRAIDFMLTNPGSGDGTALSDLLLSYRNRNPALARRLIQALTAVRRNGVLRPRPVPHVSILGIARAAVEQAGESWLHFTPTVRDNGQTLELRWQMPAGERLDREETIRHALLSRFNEQNRHLAPAIEVIEDAGILPPGSSGRILLRFRPDVTSLSDFQRTMSEEDFIVGRGGAYRSRTPLEIVDALEEQAKLFLEGFAADDPERQAFLNELFGDGTAPGIDASVRDIDRLGDAPNVHIESYTRLDPETRVPRAARRSNVREIRDLGDALAYLTHFIPEFGVTAWAFLARGAAPLFTAAAIKGAMRGHVSVRDHMLFVSRETMGWRHWNDLHVELATLTGVFAGASLPQPVRNYATLRLVSAEYLRERYMLSPEITAPGLSGRIRYREASAYYDDNGLLVEQFPVYDGPGPRAMQIGQIRRHRDLSRSDPPVYDAVRKPGGGWVDIDNASVRAEGDRPDDGMYAHIINQIYRNFQATRASERNGDGDRAHVVLVDETGIGTFDFLTAFALETRSHVDEEAFPPDEELARLRRTPIADLTPESAARWRDLEAGYLRARETDASWPVEAEIFIASPPSIDSSIGFPQNDFHYLTVDPYELAAKYGLTMLDAFGRVAQTSTAADNSPNLYFVDLDAVRGKGYVGQQRPDQIPFDMGAPILGQSVPLQLERPSIQIAAYLRDLFIYNGVVHYYETEYQRLAVRSLLIAAESGAPEIRRDALNALAGYAFPATLQGLLRLSRRTGADAPAMDAVAAPVLRALLRDAIVFNGTGSPEMLLNYELLRAQRRLLTDLSAENNPMEETRGLATNALRTLKDAQDASVVLGLPAPLYLTLTKDQKRLLRDRAVFVVPVISQDAATQAEEMKRAADGLGLARTALAAADWRAPDRVEAQLYAAIAEGAVIPRFARVLLTPFAVLLSALGLPPSAALTAYRTWGAATAEEIAFSAAPVLLAGLIALGAPSWGGAALALLIAAPLRIAFLFLHPAGRRDGAAVVSLVGLASLALPFFLDGSGFFLAVILPWLAHLAVNTSAEKGRSREARLADETALAISLARAGRTDLARRAVRDLLDRAPVSLDLDEIDGARSFAYLSAAVDGSLGLDRAAFGRALADALKTQTGRAELTTSDAVALLQTLARQELDADAPDLGAALDHVNGIPAAVPSPTFLHLVVDDTAARDAEKLLKIALQKRRNANEAVMVTVFSAEAAARVTAAAAGRNVTVRVLDTAAPDAAGRRRVKVADLPAALNGAVPRALIASDGVELDLEGLAADSPYRDAAVLLINLALKAVVLPSVGELERTARLIATQA